MKTTNTNTFLLDKEELLSIITKTYISVIRNYNDIFNEKGYLPTKEHSSLGINGFTERNLSFNFCHSYLSKRSNAIVWQEIPINVDRQHVDSIIIDNNCVIYLEAKRFYNLKYFNNLLEDLNRIKNPNSETPLPKDYNPDHRAVVLLADHYYHGVCNAQKYKMDYYDNYFTGQNVKELPQKIREKDPKFADEWTKNVESAKISIVSNDIKDSTIKINGNKYNIDIKDEIVYTIYCGVCFLD